MKQLIVLLFISGHLYAQQPGSRTTTNDKKAPSVQLVTQLADTSSPYILNQSTQQPNSQFNISGQGVVGGNLGIGTVPLAKLHVSSGGLFPVLVESNNIVGTGLSLKNTSGESNIWSIVNNGTGRTPPGSLSIVSQLNKIAVSALPNGYIGINDVPQPTEALQVNGNIKASGNVIIDVEYVKTEVSIDKNSNKEYYLSCPAGKKVIGGGGGHRDLNSAIKDINVAYSGPDFYTGGARWLIYVHNSGGSSRALTLYCACAKVQ